MKKLLLLLLLTSNFIVFGQSINIKNFKMTQQKNQTFYSGSKVNYEFEIQGDYSQSTHGYHQINLKVYKNSVSSSNLIASSQWNREDDYDIIYQSYTIKPWWSYFWSSFPPSSYSTNVGNKFYLVVEYAGLTKTLSYTYSNPPVGNPDLVVDENNSTVVNSGDNNSSRPISDNVTYYMSSSDYLSVNLKVKNIGNLRSNSMKVAVYASYGSNFNNATFVKSQSYQSIDNGSSYSKIIQISSSDIMGAIGDGTGHLHFKVDYENTNSEGNTGENNNVFSYIKVNTSNGAKISNVSMVLENENFKKEDVSYNYLQIYNSLGSIVLSLTKQSFEKENEIINNLKSGLYFIKSNYGDRKVLVE